MIEYSKVNVKLTDTERKKLKAAVKIKKQQKMLDKNGLPSELLLTRRQKAKLRNAFNNNMPTDIKLSKAQISKIIQSRGSLDHYKVN